MPLVTSLPCRLSPQSRRLSLSCLWWVFNHVFLNRVHQAEVPAPSEKASWAEQVLKPDSVKMCGKTERTSKVTTEGSFDSLRQGGWWRGAQGAGKWLCLRDMVGAKCLEICPRRQNFQEINSAENLCEEFQPLIVGAEVALVPSGPHAGRELPNRPHRLWFPEAGGRESQNHVSQTTGVRGSDGGPVKHPGCP